MKNILTGILAFQMCATTFAATIGNIDISTNADGFVVVTYSLDSDAIVTADLKSKGVSLGGERQWSLSGDVFKLVSAGSGKKITWNPEQDIPETELTDVTVELKAWTESDAPDYMVAELLQVSDCRIRYYPSADFLPGGIVSNEYYRLQSLVFRKIRAKNVEWTMGTTSELGRSTSGNEEAHTVNLDRNYYMAVFETTKAQGEAVGSTRNATSPHANTSRWRLTPIGRSPWNNWRGTMPPSEPSTGSILGKFSSRTGLKVDLPTEAQWEFAARGGHEEGTWGDGSKILKTKNAEDVNLTRLAIYKYNVAEMTETGTCSTNSYGLYDMHGNVAEFCQDWYQPDITGLNGALCAHPDDSSLRADGIAGTNRVVRGGYWSYNPMYVRASYRGHSVGSDEYKSEMGGRMMTFANLGEEMDPTVAASQNAISKIDTRKTQTFSAISDGAVELRTVHSFFSDAFALDTLTPKGLAFVLR